MAKKDGFKGERAIIIPSSIVKSLDNDIFWRDLHITDIGYYPQAHLHYRERKNEEALQFVLIYCIDGEGWFEVNGKKEIVEPHQFFVLPKGVAHKYGSNKTKPWTIYWIHFDGEKAAFFSEGLDKPLLVSPEKDSRIEDRFKLFEEVFSTLKNGYSKNNLEFSITALFYFFGSLKYLSTYRACNNSSQQLQQRDVADEAIHFMRENVRKRLTLKEIADYVGISQSYFSTLFQSKTGYSPLNYFIHLKIQEACHHLDFTDMKINQISLLVGFEDPFYFSRLFTKTMGNSPREYREKKKG